MSTEMLSANWTRLQQAMGADDIVREPMLPEKLRVLVLEDNPIDRKAMVRALQEISNVGEIVEVPAVKAAIEALSTSAFDIAVLDYNLPDGTGTEVLPTATERSVSCIIVTGAGNERVAVKAMREGAADYLVKDVKGEYLNLLPSTFEQVCRQRDLELERQQLLARVSEALETIEFMSSFVRICCVCKKIRVGDDKWEQLESYMSRHVHTQFSHGYCPTCYERERSHHAV